MGRNNLTPQQIEFEHEAKRRAGHCDVLMQLPGRYPQYQFPTFLGLDERREVGSETVKGLDASSHFSSPLFKVCHVRFKQTLSKPYKDSVFEHLENLDHAFSDARAGRGGIYFDNTSQVIELAPFATVREKLEIVAGYPAKRLNLKPSATAAQVDAFTTRHELQHGRYRATWLNPHSGMVGTGGSKQMPLPKLAQNSAGYRKLFEKTSQSKSFGENYIGYLDESMSDTVAALHHLKEGGDVAFIQEFSEARRNAFTSRGRTFKYASYAMLDHISANNKSYTSDIENLSDEQIEDLAAHLVGTKSMDREEYYERSMVAQALEVCRAHQGDIAEIDWQKEAGKKGSLLGKTWMNYNGKHLSKRDADAGNVDVSGKSASGDSINSFIVTALQKHGNDMKKQIFTSRAKLNRGPALTAPEHALDIYAAIKHQQNRHPEYEGPDGAKYLLAKRKHYIVAHYAQLKQDVPELDREAHSLLDDHLEQERDMATEPQMDRAQNQSHQPT